MKIHPILGALALAGSLTASAHPPLPPLPSFHVQLGVPRPPVWHGGVVVREPYPGDRYRDRGHRYGYGYNAYCPEPPLPPRWVDERYDRPRHRYSYRYSDDRDYRRHRRGHSSHRTRYDRDGDGYRDRR